MGIGAIGRRTFWDPPTVLIVGAEPIGLLAALIGVPAGDTYYRAAKVVAAADPAWLEQLITRRSRPEQAQQALQRTPDDIKVVIEFDQS